jgi:hypothetical protein
MVPLNTQPIEPVTSMQQITEVLTRAGHAQQKHAARSFTRVNHTHGTKMTSGRHNGRHPSVAHAARAQTNR